MQPNSYKLVIAKSVADFEKAVTEALQDGWELYGSPTVQHEEPQSDSIRARRGSYLLAQALVRERVEDLDPEKLLIG